MALRHANVQETQVEKKMLDVAPFSLKTIIKMKVSLQIESILLKPHPEDPMDGITLPPYLVLREKIKRFSMARSSTIKTYLLPVPVFMTVAMQLSHIKVC
jgi:hypothetical protein